MIDINYDLKCYHRIGPHDYSNIACNINIIYQNLAQKLMIQTGNNAAKIRLIQIPK